jgi:hypothetical protein
VSSGAAAAVSLGEVTTTRGWLSAVGGTNMPLSLLCVGAAVHMDVSENADWRSRARDGPSDGLRLDSAGGDGVFGNFLNIVKNKDRVLLFGLVEFRDLLPLSGTITSGELDVALRTWFIHLEKAGFGLATGGGGNSFS